MYSSQSPEISPAIERLKKIKFKHTQLVPKTPAVIPHW